VARPGANRAVSRAWLRSHTFWSCHDHSAAIDFQSDHHAHAVQYPHAVSCRRRGAAAWADSRVRDDRPDGENAYVSASVWR
jgi:hypothetical protein